MIPVFEPLLFGDEAEAIAQTLSQGNISGTSPTVRRFEEAFARRVGTRYAVAASNGTAAPHLALMALGVKPGDEVIVPDLTIISDALAVVLCGAKPVFADVNETDGCLNVRNIEKLVTPKTVGILAVHLYGHACDMDFLVDFSKKRNLWLMEDAAQALGGTWQGKQLGSLGNLATYSFYSNKFITMGEGGAVVTQDERLATQMRVLANLGFDPRPEHRFIHVALSNNYRLSSVQAAMGLAQLNHWEEIGARRSRLRGMYADALSTVRGILLPTTDTRCKPAFWTCAIVLDSQSPVTVPELQKRLAEREIETRRFFYPLHAQPVLKSYHSQWDDKFPVASSLFERGLYLPSSSKLSWEDIKTIASALKSCLK